MAKLDNELQTIALQIAQNGHRVGEIHRILDQHAQHGSLPVNKRTVLYQDPQEMSRGELARSLINLPPTISKANKKLATLPPTSQDYALLQANIATWSQMLQKARAIAKEV